MRTYGAGLWLFGQFVDRYATDAYGPPVSTIEAIEQAGRVGQLSCLDINYPFTDPSISVDHVREALERTGLRAHAITPHLYTRRFRAGSFTNPDPAVRAEAVSLCKQGIEIAQALDAAYLKFWPGQDGHDYPLQANYTRLWDLELAGLREVVESAPDLQFAIEYKLKEPRNHMLFSTAARTLLGIQEIGAPNLGIVLDFGHSLFAKETPADALELVHRHGRLVSVELNDNLLEWDDDMAVGSVHMMHTIEFLISLRRIGMGWAHSARPVPVSRGSGPCRGRKHPHHRGPRNPCRPGRPRHARRTHRSVRTRSQRRPSFKTCCCRVARWRARCPLRIAYLPRNWRSGRSESGCVISRWFTGHVLGIWAASSRPRTFWSPCI